MTTGGLRCGDSVPAARTLYTYTAKGTLRIVCTFVYPYATQRTTLCMQRSHEVDLIPLLVICRQRVPPTRVPTLLLRIIEGI